MILNRLNTLAKILEDRLPHIRRWEKVGLYFHGDNFPKNTIDNELTMCGQVYILWSNPKGKNIANPYEYKAVPLDIEHLDAMIKRQREKLRTESENL